MHRTRLQKTKQQLRRRPPDPPAGGCQACGTSFGRGTPSVHPIRGDEIRALHKLRRENLTEAYVFVSKRGGPISPMGFHHLIARLGKAATLPFAIHPHMLRHACGFKLANDGHDTRSLQHYLGHKNIQHTVRYTELSPDRFKDFWRD
jgi:type 1 fimbriae regulatory protein FimB/type 1 fimbriae regulatory protein FimE